MNVEMKVESEKEDTGTVAKGCQCLLAYLRFVDTWIFHDYCSSTGCVISGEKLLFMMWSVLV